MPDVGHLGTTNKYQLEKSRLSHVRIKLVSFTKHSGYSFGFWDIAFPSLVSFVASFLHSLRSLFLAKGEVDNVMYIEIDRPLHVILED